MAATGLRSAPPDDGASNMEFTTQAHLVNDSSQSQVPIVINTGCSISVTPFLSDFVTVLTPPQEDSMTGLKGSIPIKGEGWVEWTVQDVFGHQALIRTRAHHVPDA